MTAYDVYLAWHIGAAITWVGAAFMMVLFGTRAILGRDITRVISHARDSEWLGLRVFLPSNLLVLASAFLLVEEGNWGYEALWIQLALAGFGVSFLTGALVFGPGWARVGKTVGAEGAETPSVLGTVRRLLLVSYVDLGLLLGVVFVMTVKPDSGNTEALATAAAISAVVALAGFGLTRVRARREAPGALGAPSVK